MATISYFDACCLVDGALCEVKAVEDYSGQKQCLEWWNLARNLALSGQPPYLYS